MKYTYQPTVVQALVFAAIQAAACLPDQPHGAERILRSALSAYDIAAHQESEELRLILSDALAKEAE